MMQTINNHCSDERALNTGRSVTDALASPAFLSEIHEQPRKELNKLICIYRIIYSSTPLRELQSAGSSEKPNPNCGDVKTHYVQYGELNAEQLWQTLHSSVH
jgi:hypothetical protein